MKDKIFDKFKKELPSIRKNISLRDYTTFKIGGLARYFFEAKTKEDLIKAIKTAKDLKVPFFIFGGGSNLLVSDRGFDGLAIKNQISNLKNQKYKSKIKNIYISADGGVSLNDLVNFCVKDNLTGLEWAVGIPGTVGGAVYGNAQAFGSRMADSLEKVEALDCLSLKIKNFSKKDCKFSLKNSIFKKNKNLIILSVVLKLKKGNKKNINKKIKEFLEYRRKSHPKLPSAGSVFINREVKIKDKKLLEEFPELIEFNKKGYVPSSYLIDKCGLKGTKIGGAQISSKHAGFILNIKKAKAKDVLALMRLAKSKVKQKFGINLEEEIQIIK